MYVRQPREQAWHYIVGRNVWGIKYEIVCAIGNPRIVWINGPWKGSAHDASIAVQSGVKQHLLPREQLLADKAYKGDRFSFIVPISGHRWMLSQNS